MKQRMIMSRTPLRITFAGGGTDLPEYYRTHGPGAVVSAAIDKYIYVLVNKKFDHKIRVSYSHTEIVDHVDQIRHPTVREALKLLNIDGGIEIVSISDIPSQGTGLGSSSTFLVGLLNALHAYRGELASAGQLAKEAVMIERQILEEPGGKQDQYAAAYGGLNMIVFNRDESVEVKPLISDEDTRMNLNSHLLLLYTGKERSSATIHNRQKATVEEKIKSYDSMKNLAYELYRKLSTKDYNSTGQIMHANWALKKGLASGITWDFIDQCYDEALKMGATGGKLIGAGGGGFLLFFAKPELHERIAKALELRKVDFNIQYQGSGIIYVGD
ncbi:kinase [Oxyplasma meridianum]|uniref:Kinase n=1 Tax=Oxyplasma meridianum TaxID=3073602 RepID=A0AAX4NG10_9ARCH